MKQPKTNHYNLGKYKGITLDSLLHIYNNDRDYGVSVNKQDNKIKSILSEDNCKPYVNHVY